MAEESEGLYIGMAIRLFVLIFAVVVFTKMYVALEQPPGTITTHTLSFPSPVRVANLILPAADYRVKYIAESNRDFGLFIPASDANAYQGLSRLELLPVRADKTEQQYELDPSGNERLVALTWEGESFKHVF